MEDVVKTFYLFVVSGVVLIWALGTGMAKDGLVEADTRSLRRAVFTVENLTCGACFSNINEGLAPLEGFSGMGVNLFRKRLAVDFVAPLSVDKIGDAITRKGYPAILESVGPIMEKEGFAYLNARRKGPVSGGCCSGGNSVSSQGQRPPVPAEIPQSGIQQGGSCCILPNGSKLPPVTLN
jgi:copper chaperone CopZ